MRPGVLVLSGFNFRAVVALCRWAAGAGLPLHLVPRDPHDPIYLTDYAKHAFTRRTSQRLDAGVVHSWIKRLRADHGYDRVLLAPTTEFFNRVILRNRVALEAAGGIVPLVGQAIYEQISDKFAFAGLCAAHGLSIPAPFARVPDRLPFVAKPRTYGAATSGRIKPYLIRSPGERDEFLRREHVGNFFFQEFVEGRSLYLLAHVSRSGAVTACAQENLIQQPQGGSIVLARAHDFHRHADATHYVRLLTMLGFHGLIMIEVRRCARTGRHVMIEANPRPWGPFQFTLDQGVDLLEPFFADHGFAPQAPALTPTHSHYFWSEGLAGSAAPPTYHNYSVGRFRADRPLLATADLFNRADTFRLHARETVQPKAA